MALQTKPFKIHLFSIVLFASFCSCSRSIESRIIGKWDSAEAAVYITNSIFVSDTLNNDQYGEMTFREGGSGTFKEGTEKSQFEWFVEKNQVTIALDSAESRTFDVHINDDKDQVWYYYKVDSATYENDITSKEEWISILSLTKIRELDEE